MYQQNEIDMTNLTAKDIKIGSQIKQTTTLKGEIVFTKFFTVCNITDKNIVCKKKEATRFQTNIVTTERTSIKSALQLLNSGIKSKGYEYKWELN